MVTETSIDWTLNNLIENLVQERNAMSLGKQLNISKFKISSSNFN